MSDANWKKLEHVERKRSYVYRDGSRFTVENVGWLSVSASGMHYLTTDDGCGKYIVSPGWVAIELDMDDWPTPGRSPTPASPMSHDAAAEAAERKRVMEAVAQLLEAGLWLRGVGQMHPEDLAAVVSSAITELRTPVGREKGNAARAAERRDQEEGR